MDRTSFSRLRRTVVVVCCGLGGCLEIPADVQNMDNPNSTRYEAECDCYAYGTSITTTHLVKTCDVPARYVDEFATEARLRALCDEGDSQFTNCELNPFLEGSDGNIGCGSIQSCVPYGCCYAYGPMCTQIQCTNSVLLEDGDLNCLGSSSRVAPSAGPSMWSHATVTSGTLQINTPEGNATTQLAGTLAFIGGNCATGTCPFEVVDVSLGADPFDLQGHTVSDPFVINDTTGAGSLYADAAVFMLPAQSLEIYATATVEGDRHGLVAASDTPGVGLINQSSRQLVFSQSFNAYGDSIDIQVVASIDNLAPTVTLSAAPSYECNAPGGANVEIAAQAADVDGHISTVQWFVDGAQVAGTSTTLTAFVPLGAHTIEVAVFDNDGAVASASASIEVSDTTPPSLSFDTFCLWPPNHDLFAIDASSVHVTDACDPNVTVTFLSGSSDQSDNGLGDGDTDNDLVVKPDSICARAEREGMVLYGRTYAIKAAATDTAGNQGELTFDITVPHDFSPMCATGGEPTDASDPRCVPPTPSVAPTTEPPANVATTQAVPVRDGCSSGGQPRGLVVIGFVMGLTLRRRRHR